eukprot:11183807-Lingulodinium_polyedra.AAC.1
MAVTTAQQSGRPSIATPLLSIPAPFRSARFARSSVTRTPIVHAVTLTCDRRSPLRPPGVLPAL